MSGPLQDTGLRRGDAATIARIHRVSRQHVAEVAAGRRSGNAKLIRTIERYRAKARVLAADVIRNNGVEAA